jgi:hypothetical protein
MPGTWKPLGHQPPVAIDTMLLLTDGSVMCHDLLAPDWYRLTPDAFMDYANGSWHKLTPMPANAPPGENGPVDAPLYYASAVLRDGRVFVAGGEYNVDGGTGSIFGPPRSTTQSAIHGPASPRRRVGRTSATRRAACCRTAGCYWGTSTPCRRRSSTR